MRKNDVVVMKEDDCFWDTGDIGIIDGKANNGEYAPIIWFSDTDYSKWFVIEIDGDYFGAEPGEFEVIGRL